MFNAPRQLDTSIEIVTPENIAFRYRVAGPFRRLPAYLIDLAIRLFVAGAALLGLSFAFGVAGVEEMGLGLAFIAWFLLAWFYGVLFETWFNGQTPGKWLMQIRVVATDGQPVGALQALLRNVLRFADAQPAFFQSLLILPFYQLGLLSSAISERCQRLGDLVCGTMVIVETRPRLDGLVRFAEPEVAELAGQIPANFTASRTLARALATYVARRRNFSFGRRLEIARHLAEPLRQRFQLPPRTNPDLLLCALYHRVFLTEGQPQSRAAAVPVLLEESRGMYPSDPAAAMAAMDRYR